jgi:tRNA threonylcarbamoyladenosine biosynthesis protein TsaE
MSAAAAAHAPATTTRLGDEAACDRVGAALGRALSPGDAVLLSGPLGAGKSRLARAAIGARLADAGLAADVPSPTYTLANVYETPDAALWHADLYRLSALEELDELGLSEAFETAICLVEWPERLGPAYPARALLAEMALVDDPQARVLTLRPQGSGWEAALRAVGAAA